MIESPEDGGNHLVRVRAQVMSRDDTTGGWVPLEGGGLSNVSVTKKARVLPSTVPGSEHIANTPKNDYMIYGRRISDESIVLSCTIKKDFEYNKVMPTFHHWRTEDKKFGLTFQTAADARAFDKGVRTAVEDLLDGLTETHPPPLHINRTVPEEDVFMTLNLPQEPKDSRSSSDSSTKGTEHLHKIQYLPRDRPTEPKPPPTFESIKDKGENYSYVQLTAVHEYVYPMGEDQKPGLTRRDSTSSLKKGLELTQHVPYPYKGKPLKKPAGKQQVLCRHCNDYFFEDKNQKGNCEYAPDCVKATINRITCIGCAQCVCYHCASDNEGDFAQHPCECTNDDNCCKRWMCLTFLSLFVPCLWFYPPLRLCYWCGVQCGICGGRHSTSM